uniref:Uncharacterized mitochondrial protein AtMg00810-like n=1 Tax=Nicotiana tabacum TaxID=4097 RepID=A0A1S3ZJ72_TOBAC|nr:PREDICTED: uncharacterized mitochondrial protein AtMg00810-like [Nicotiana tabacum]
MEAAMRVVKYVKNQPGRGILLPSSNNNNITTYYDADWAACPISRKLVIGYLIKIGDSLVAWKSKKQTIVSRSTAKAEYRSIAATVAELIWLQGLMQEIGIELVPPLIEVVLLGVLDERILSASNHKKFSRGERDDLIDVGLMTN